VDHLEDFFNDNADLSHILERGDKVSAKKLRKKELLFNEGDPAKYLYYIIKGKVKTFRTNEQGKEYITQIYTAGNFFGYTSLLDAGIYMESAIAIEDAEIASIPRQDFYQLLAGNPELYGHFIKFISSDLSETNDKLIKLAYNSARKKVSDAILMVARKYHSELADNISFSISRDDISAISGISPESVSRNLTDLKEEKLIELQNGTIKITDVRRLSTVKN
jgi:CRP-like cAMP-binding protein